MRKMQIRTAISLLAFALSGGCASQNAMTMIPGNLKAEIAAEKAERAPGKGAVSVEAMLAAARKDSGKISDPGEGANAPVMPSADQALAADSGPPRMQPPAKHKAGKESGRAPHPAGTARRILPLDDVEDGADYEGVTAPDVWARFQDMQAGSEAALARERPSADTRDVTLTASLPEKPRGDPVELSFAGEVLERDSNLKLRLMLSAGRKADRIVIGKVAAGTPFEALAAAQARAGSIRSVTGGQPGISYDPALKSGAAMVHFAPNPRRDG